MFEQSLEAVCKHTLLVTAAYVNMAVRCELEMVYNIDPCDQCIHFKVVSYSCNDMNQQGTIITQQRLLYITLLWL
jgi:hypothetical protein